MFIEFKVLAGWICICGFVGMIHKEDGSEYKINDFAVSKDEYDRIRKLLFSNHADSLFTLLEMNK